MQELNNQTLKRNELLAKVEGIKSQLKLLGIDVSKLKKPQSSYLLHAESEGVVSEIVKPLNTMVSQESTIINLVSDRSLYLQSFIPLSYANHVKLGQKIFMEYNGEIISTRITEILPELDEQTQKVIVFSAIESSKHQFFINTYLFVTLSIDTDKSYVSVKKSALSFMNNEWVVFVPKEEDHEEDEGHEGHEGHEEHHNEDESKEDSHEHEEEEVPYEAKVVQVIIQNSQFVAVEGIGSGEEYVSDKSYYIKSLLLKSSLGGHGH